MSQVLNNPVFPCHKHTFQGTAAAVTMEFKPYEIVHADEAGDIVVTWEDATSTTYTLGAGEDVTIAGAISVTSTMSVKVS